MPLRHQKSAENIPSLCNSLDPSRRRAVPSGWHDPLPPHSCIRGPTTAWLWRPSSDPASSPEGPSLPTRPPGLSYVPSSPRFCEHLPGCTFLLHSPVFPVSHEQGQRLVPDPSFIPGAERSSGCSINVCQVSDGVVSAMKIDGALPDLPSITRGVEHDWEALNDATCECKEKRRG